VRADTTLATLKQFMTADAPALKLLEARIGSLKAQQNAVESETTETARTRDQALSQLMGSYEELESERHFAETAYQHALEALDRARMNADRQQIYIADFVPPSMPEESLYPRRWRSLGIVLLAAFVVWAIGSLTVRSVRDHL
jgi:capsular polysaccharide transport system permease protein